MGLFNSKKGALISDYFKLLDTIGNFEADNMYDVALFDSRIEVSSPFKNNKIILDYSQITDVFYGCKTDLKEVNKSVIGRALAGGLLFGGLGAVVGSVSGIGTKTKKEKNMYLIIGYESSQGDAQFIQFEDTRMYKGKKLADMLRNHTQIGSSNTNIQL